MGNSVVEIIVMADASSGMESNAKAFCAELDKIYKENDDNIRLTYLSIEGTIPNTRFTTTVRNYLTNLGVCADDLKGRKDGSVRRDGAREDIARSIIDISLFFDWGLYTRRKIIVLGSEWPDGGGVNPDEFVTAVNDNAISMARQCNVAVYSYLGQLGSDQKYPSPAAKQRVHEEYARITRETGGKSYAWDENKAILSELLGDVLNSGDIAAQSTERWNCYLDAKNESGITPSLKVKKGDVMTISVTGEADFGHKEKFGPEGNPALGASSNLVYQDAPYGSVLVKIGSLHYKIGAGVSEWAAPADGEVTFVYNDWRGYYHDNAGGFEISVAVERQ